MKTSCELHFLVFLFSSLNAGCFLGEPNDDPSECVVATVKSVKFTRRDAKSLALLIQPPPSEDVASRLLVDVVLAEWLMTQSVQPSAPMRQRFTHHMTLHKQVGKLTHSRRESLNKLKERLEEAQEQSQLEFGPCYVR